MDSARDMYNVYPAEVERVLRQHPGLEDVAVVGVPDKMWGEVGHAFVVCKSGSNLVAGDIVSYCDGRLACYKWPKKIVL